MNTTAHWHGCYNDSWKGLIVSEAFAHPAKFARGLIERIIEHGLAEGYWQKGSLIGDPMCGIGTGGIIAASRGLRWVGVELEERFVELANQNFERHKHTWETMGDPLPVVIQGDAREFCRLVGECEAVVTSPPFVGQMQDQQGNRVDWSQVKEGGRNPTEARTSFGKEYGTTPGQIGSLKEGTLDGAVTEETCDGIVTSPPWESQMTSGGDTAARKGIGRADASAGGALGRSQRAECDGYGSSHGQIGRESGPTYWTEMAKVYRQTWLALRTGGVLCLVLKDYVKAGKRVPLCDNTCTLLEAVGFTVFERMRAWLVTREEHPSLFGGTVAKVTERKSFFRRLAEKKGSPRIDWEEVIWCRK